MSLSTHNEQAAENKELALQKQGNAFAENRESASDAMMAVEARDSGAVDIASSVNIQGNVAESVKKATNEQGSTGQSQATTQGDDQSATDFTLDEVQIPAPKVVVRKVKTALEREIQVIEQDIKKLQRNPMKHAYALTKAIEVLGKLKKLLTDLAGKSWDQMKNLWLQIYNKKTLAETL